MVDIDKPTTAAPKVIKTTKTIKTSAGAESSGSVTIKVKKSPAKAKPTKRAARPSLKAAIQSASKTQTGKPVLRVVEAFKPLTLETIMANTQNKFNNDKMQEAYAQFEQVAQETKATTEAVVKATTVWVKGMEELSRGWFAYSQKAFEKSTEASKELMGAKTLNEAIEKQSQFAQKSLNDLVSETTRLSEQAVKVSTEAFDPLKKRFEQTAEKVSKAMAA